MNTYWIAFIGLAAVSVLALLIGVAGSSRKKSGKGSGKNVQDDLVAQAKEDVEHIFNEDFREELRNRGRLHFENIINENAMFLQQDLRLTTSQINDYLKEQITKNLRDTFEEYQQSITAARDQAIESIHKTQTAIEEQRVTLEQELKTQFAADRDRLLKKFEDNMAEILNHYIIDAIGNEIDLSDQLDYIFGHLEENKQAILEDIRSGA